MKNQNYVFNVPSELKNDIEKINFSSSIRKNQALRFLHILRNKGFQDNHDMLKYQELSSTWFRDMFTSHYKKQFLDILVENDIIERNDSYSEELEYPKSFRINEKYYSSIKSYSDISYSDKSSSDDNIYFYSNNPVSFYTLYPSIYKYTTVASLLLSFSKKEKKQYLNSLRLSFPSIKKKAVIDMIDSLNIDYVSIMKATKDTVQEISAKNFSTDEAVGFSYFKVYNRISKNSYYTSKENALNYCRKAKLTLIQDKDKVYIDDLDRYVETKKINIYSAYTQKSSDLKKGIYHPHRNQTNNRFDTIFTSMCKPTLEIIKRDNDLIEIDLVNSQFAILANWLSNEECYQHEDVKLFCDLAIKGKLYEYIATQLGIERKQAKKMMFMICFSDYRFNSPLKSKFKELFPHVNSFVNSFKKNADNSSEFPIELQKRESKLFIDGLMRLLVEKGLFVLTKHDSLIIKRQDEKQIVPLVLGYFNRVNLKATVAVDDVVIHSGVMDAQIQDETISEYKYQEEENGADNGARNTNLDFEFLDKIEKEVRFQYGLYINDRYKQNNGVKFPINYQNLLEYR